MNYYIECKSIFDRSNLIVLNDSEEQVAQIQYNKISNEYQIEIYNIITTEKYYIKSNPLKFKRRFIVFNNDKTQIARIAMGVKIIHSIIESEKYLFVKAAFWKIRYQAYDDRTVVSKLEIVRKNKKRYFHIMSKDNDFVVVISLFLLAQAVRMKVILN